MKRILVLLIACVLIFSMMVCISACGPKSNDDQKDPGTTDTPGTDTPDDTIDEGPDLGGGIQLPVIPITPSTPETEEGTEGENSEN